MEGAVSFRTAGRLLLVAALCLTATACGRRGPPEPPPTASVIATDEEGNVIEQPAEPVDRPFILDPLLQ